MSFSGLQRTDSPSPAKLASIMAGITGTHILLYSDNPEADRAFFRDILGFRSVDAGQGWLIFAIPPAETGIHPTNGDQPELHGARTRLGADLYLSPDACPPPLTLY